MLLGGLSHCHHWRGAEEGRGKAGATNNQGKRVAPLFWGERSKELDRRSQKCLIGVQSSVHSRTEERAQSSFEHCRSAARVSLGPKLGGWTTNPLFWVSYQKVEKEGTDQGFECHLRSSVCHRERGAKKVDTGCSRRKSQTQNPGAFARSVLLGFTWPRLASV